MAVFGRGLVPQLPGTVHLIPEAPNAAIPRLRAAVLGPEVGPVAAALVVDIFDEGPRLVEASGTEIEGQHHFSARLLGPLGEFMDADQIWLRGAPGQVEPSR